MGVEFLLSSKSPKYSNAEKEILSLKATIESISSMVNHEVLTLHHNDPHSEIRFPTSIHQKYFNIILQDFFNAKIFGVNEKCLKALQEITKKPEYNKDVKSLEEATQTFQNWLVKSVEFKHEGESRKLWFPSIDQEITLKITRIDFINICGNISKHNSLALDRQAKTIKKIFKKSDVEIDVAKALNIMGEFYEQFHVDLFNYHSSAIVEFLNKIHWAIHEYLQPLKKTSEERYWNKHDKRYHNRYNCPENIKDKYVKMVFCNLMYDGSEPFFPPFEVTKHLKSRY